MRIMNPALKLLKRANQGLSLLGQRGASALGYLLQANFDVENQAFSDAQVLGVDEGVVDGSLTVVLNTGSMSIASNKVAYSSHAGSYADYGLYYADGITRQFGRTLMGKMLMDALTSDGADLALRAAAGTDITAGSGVERYHYQIDSENQGFVLGIGGIEFHHDLLLPAQADTEYDYAIVVGGYNSSGEPYLSGDKSNYTYGASFFVKGGVYTNWRVIFRTKLGNFSPMYPAFANPGVSGTFDDMGVPEQLLTGTMEFIAASLFNADNGTSLDAYSPDIGGNFTELNGDWEIQSNKAQSDGLLDGRKMADVDAGNNDAIVVEASFTLPGSGGWGPCLCLRATDTGSDNYILLFQWDNELRINKVENGTGSVLQAGETRTIANGAKITLTAVLDGSTITGYMHTGGVRGAWVQTTTTFNQSATLMGVGEFLDGSHGPSKVDEFAIYPLTDSAYDVLDSV